MEKIGEGMKDFVINEVEQKHKRDRGALKEMERKKWLLQNKETEDVLSFTEFIWCVQILQRKRAPRIF
jgi:hypothetical protein